MVSPLKRGDGVYKRSSASMDKSFDGMHQKYDFDLIRFSVKKTISISMIVTSVILTADYTATLFQDSRVDLKMH